MSGMNMAGGPMSGIGVMKALMGGGGGGGDEEQNPGQKMFGMPAANEPNFGQRFLNSMRDNLFQSAMRGFMGRG